MKKPTLGILISLAVLVALVSLRGFDVIAQEQVSATPVNVSLPTATPITTQQFAETPTATRTPTAVGPVQLTPRESAGPVNVRLLPDPESERLGAISPGERFNVTGRYFEWYQIQYDLSPNGRAWIFGQLVEIIGDASTITDVDPFAEPTVDSAIVAATQTWEAITQTPGGILTATANARVLPAPTSNNAASANSDTFDSTAEADAIAPTFTYPPDIVAIAPTRGEASANTGTTSPETAPAQSEGIAPLLPIVILGGVGLVGLFISSFRRS